MPQLDLVFDAVVADPPYFKIVSEDWDRQWGGLDDYVEWLERVIIEIKKALTAKGSLYVFGDDKTIAYVQVMIDRYLTLLNSLVWFKVNNQSVKAAPNLRSYAPMTERILFYTPQLCPTGLETVMTDANNFIPLRHYFKGEKERLGLSYKQINAALGTATNGGGMASHYFNLDKSQWSLPTAEMYNRLQSSFNGFLRREYEDLRREYEDLRREYEDLRRTFNATSKTFDVISGPIVSQSDNTDHPTTKPLWLITHLIQTCTNQGDIILDPFVGSGTTLLAAQNEGRQAIGIEISEEYCKIAVGRLRQPSFFSIPDKPKSEIAKQKALL
jgi:site-specific DNA-methyltransferase (adenine-specific)